MENNKKPTTIIIILLIILIGIVLFKNKVEAPEVVITNETPAITTETTNSPAPVVSQPKTTTSAPKSPTPSQPTVAKAPHDLKNTWIIVDGRQVKVVNGFALITAGDPSNNETFSYAGYETIGDINGDKKVDVVALYTRQNKNTKNLYYIVAGMSTLEDGYKTSNIVAIDQGITMQSVKIDAVKSEVLINYLQKKQTDSATTPPSVPTTVVIKPVVGTAEIEKVR